MAPRLLHGRQHSRRLELAGLHHLLLDLLDSLRGLHGDEAVEVEANLNLELGLAVVKATAAPRTTSDLLTTMIESPGQR